MNPLKSPYSLFLVWIIFVSTGNWCFAQVGINFTGAAPDSSAILDVSSTTKGALLPRMSTAQRNAIGSPAEGLQIYNTTTKCFEYYLGATWQSLGCGCSSVPAAAATISGTATVCPGQSAVLYAVPAITGATTYLWSYSGTGVTIVGNSNAAIIYFSQSATSGNLTVTGNNACGNGAVSAGYAVTVNSTAPNITAQPSSPAAVCAGTGTPSFTVTATGGQTYQWQEFVISWNNVADAGVYSGATTGTLTITDPPVSMNNYKYRCIVSGTCTSTTSDGAATLTVNPLTGAAGTISGTATVCTGQNGVSYSVAPIANATSYSWSYSGTGATISGSTNPVTINFSSGTTPGNLTVMGTNGCGNGTVSANYAIAINPTPTVTNTPLAQTICSGGSTAVVNLSSGVNGTTFVWSATAASGISGFTSSGTGPIPVQTINNTALTAGAVTYAVIPTASGCVGATANYVVTVNPLATVTANPSSQTINSNAATSIALSSNISGATFAWTVSQSGVSGATAGSGSSIGQTLTNSNIAAGTATYTVTPTANSCAGTASNVVVTVNSALFGSGSDGAITVSANQNLNTATLASGRTCADAVNYSVTALTANTATLSSTPGTGCLVAGDEVLLINLQGTSGSIVNVGNYETVKIQSISGAVVTFATNKTKYYGGGTSDDSNSGTASTNQRVMLQRVPNYTNVTINGGFTLTANAWDGTKSGVLFFRASGMVTNNGNIDMSGNGYAGGTAGTGNGPIALGGESFCGINAGSGGTYSSNGFAGSCGGGGGAGANRTTSAFSGASGSSTGGAGGAGGCVFSDCGGNGSNGSETGGAGGGAGYGTPGTGGIGASTGITGGTNTSGAGGNSSFGGCNDNGGGGGGGGTYGNANLSVMFFGSGGAGSGGTHDTGSGAAGGKGGGIIYVSAATLSNSGNIKSNATGGSSGGAANAGSGGGAGGSIYITDDVTTLGSGTVTAIGASGGSNTYTGGAGGSGRIAVYYHTSTSGSTNPAANSQQIP